MTALTAGSLGTSTIMSTALNITAPLTGGTL